MMILGLIIAAVISAGTSIGVSAWQAGEAKSNAKKQLGEQERQSKILNMQDRARKINALNTGIVAAKYDLWKEETHQAAKRHYEGEPVG